MKPLPPFCVDEDDADGTLKLVAADDRTVTFCFHREERDKCAVLELASGSLTATAPRSAPAAAKPAPIDTSVLALPKNQEYSTVLSPDGKTIAATSEGITSTLFIVDAATGKLRKKVKWAADGGCMEPPSFIGDNIYVQYNVCAGPGATGWIVTPRGKKLGSLRHVNPTGVFHKVGETRYAFESFSGGGIEIVDATTGKSVKALDLPLSCDGCPSFGPSAFSLVQVPDGKLVQFGPTIDLVDPVAVKVDKTFTWPQCARAK